MKNTKNNFSIPRSTVLFIQDSRQRFLHIGKLTSLKRSISDRKTPPIMFPFKNAFRDNIRHEPMVSLGNSFELLRLAKQLG